MFFTVEVMTVVEPVLVLKTRVHRETTFGCEGESRGLKQSRELNHSKIPTLRLPAVKARRSSQRDEYRRITSEIENRE